MSVPVPLRQPTRHHTLEEILGIDFGGLQPDAATQFASRQQAVWPPDSEADDQPSPLDVGAADPPAALHGLSSGVPPFGAADFAATVVPPFVALPEAAEWLAVSLATLKRLLTRRELQAVRIGARRKIPLAELQRYALEGLAGRVRSASGNTSNSSSFLRSIKNSPR